MSRLSLGTYLKVLDLQKVNIKTSGQRKILNALVGSVCNEQVDISASEVSKIKKGQKDLERYIQDKIDNTGYSDVDGYKERFEKTVIPLLHPGKLNDIAKILSYIISEDDEIKSDCIIDYVSNTKKADSNNPNNPISFIAGVFLYVLKCTNNVKCEEYAEEITEEFCQKAIKAELCLRDAEAAESVLVQSEIEYQAKRFCIEYEDEIELLPLCQIAAFKDTLHKHIRQMYTDYCLCSDAVRAKILDLKNARVLNFSDANWIPKSLDFFETKIQEKGLSTRSFLYEGAKYFHRAYERYSEREANPDPYIFEPLYEATSPAFPNGHKTNLSGVVYDYLNIKKETPDANIMPPLDEIWQCCCDGNMPESEVTYWVCLMITSTCLWINDSDTNTYDENDACHVDLGDSEGLLCTLEDLYFCALMELYKLYYSR